MKYFLSLILLAFALISCENSVDSVYIGTVNHHLERQDSLYIHTLTKEPIVDINAYQILTKRTSGFLENGHENASNTVIGNYEFNFPVEYATFNNYQLERFNGNGNFYLPFSELYWSLNYDFECIFNLKYKNKDLISEKINFPKSFGNITLTNNGGNWTNGATLKWENPGEDSVIISLGIQTDSEKTINSSLTYLGYKKNTGELYLSASELKGYGVDLLVSRLYFTLVKGNVKTQIFDKNQKLVTACILIAYIEKYF